MPTPEQFNVAFERAKQVKAAVLASLAKGKIVLQE
jgi:hypothetical protein